MWRGVLVIVMGGVAEEGVGEGQAIMEMGEEQQFEPASIFAGSTIVGTQEETRSARISSGETNGSDYTIRQSITIADKNDGKVR